MKTFVAVMSIPIVGGIVLCAALTVWFSMQHRFVMAGLMSAGFVWSLHNLWTVIRAVRRYMRKDDP